MKRQICLAALAVLALLATACTPRQARLSQPGEVAGLTDWRISEEERTQFKALLAKTPNAPEAPRAAYFLALDLYHASQLSEAAQAFYQIEKKYAGSLWDRVAAYMAAHALEKAGDPVRAFAHYQLLLGPPYVADLALKARAGMARLAQGALSPEAIKSLIDYPAAEEFQPLLRRRQIEAWILAKQSDVAFSGLEDYLRRYPLGPGLVEVEALARLAESGLPLNRRTLGVLLPLSGPLAAFGLQAKQGAELALERANLKLPESERWTLSWADEGSTTENAVLAARQLFERDQVMAVLGPLSSDAAQAVLPLAMARRTPLLSPSASRSDLAAASAYFFRNCVTLEKQAQGMADHAVVSLGLTRLASLSPDSPYGRALATAFAKRSAELGAVVLVAVTYTPGTRDFHEAVLALGGSDPGIVKDADAREKREQQAAVEAASTAIGTALLALKESSAASLSSSVQVGPAALTLSADAEASDLSVTIEALAPLVFPARIAVVDLASDSSAASLNAGRAFSDRFARVLGQLEDLKITGPDESGRRLAERGLRPESLSPSSAAAFARALGADFFLGGSVTEVWADFESLSITAQKSGYEGRRARLRIKKFSENQVFLVVVQLIDARDAKTAASARFEALKMRPPRANPLNLQAVYLPGKADEVVQAAPVFRFQELPLQLLGADLWDQPALLEHAEPLEGALFTTGFFAASPDERVKAFTRDYKARYAAAPNVMAAQAYDALGLLMQAAQSASTRREAIERLLSICDYAGVSGRTCFGGRQDAVKKLPILRVASDGLEQVNP